MHKKFVLSFLLLISSISPALSITKAEQPTFDLLIKKAESLTFSTKDLEALQALTAKYPDNAELVYLLGRYLEQTGYESLAIDSYTKSAKLNPNFLPAHFHRLISLLKLHDTDEAGKELSDCLRLLKNDASGLVKLATLLESGGHYSLAERVYEVAANAPNAMSDVSIVVAEARLRQGRLDQALKALDLAIKKNSQDKEAHYLKGKILFLQNKPDASFAAFQKVYEIDPCHKGVAFGIARQHLRRNESDKALLASMVSVMCFHNDQHQLKEAKKLLESAMKSLPGQDSKFIVEAFVSKLGDPASRAFFRFAMGDIYDRLARFEQAINQYQLGVAECKGLSQNNAPLLSRGLFRLGRDEETFHRDFKKALELYTLANALAPQDVEIAASQYRLVQKMSNANNDVAGKFKSWLWSLFKDSQSASQ